MFANALAGHSGNFAGWPNSARGTLAQPGWEVGGIGESYKVLMLVILFFPAFQRVTTEYSHSVNTILIIDGSKCMVLFSQSPIALQI